MLYGAEKLLGVDDRLRKFAELAGRVLPFDIQVTEGHRSNARQAELYAQGRTKPGPVVTSASNAENSAHGRGMAIDIAPRINGKPNWDHWWQFEQIGQLAESQGLEWGGRWTSPVDGPHVQVPNWRQAAKFIGNVVASNKGSISFILLIILAVAAILVAGASWR